MKLFELAQMFVVVF